MGVLVSELQDELDETGIINSIPEDRLDLLIARADKDGDSYVTFEEFIKLVSISQIFLVIFMNHLSHHMGKPTICIGENKGADQLRSYC